jgi:hypothetical protein
VSSSEQAEILGIWLTPCNLRSSVRQRSECISLPAITPSYEPLGGIYDCHSLLESPQLLLSQIDGAGMGNLHAPPEGCPKTDPPAACLSLGVQGLDEFKEPAYDLDDPKNQEDSQAWRIPVWS